MSLARFRAEPWKTSHDSYETSVFNIRPAPEFATAEVVVASLYRSCGFDGHQEKDVPPAGRELDKVSQQPITHRNSGSQISLDTWRAVLHEILESPKQPNQSSKRFLQLCPVVPDVALYSGSARLSGNSWNPGLLIQRLICIGSESRDEAQQLWDRLFVAMSVTDKDDIWARWLEGEFRFRRRADIEWKKAPLRDLEAQWLWDDKHALRFPAQQFARDLQAILDAKACMTRRQWISLLEALLRIASVTHVLWLCDVNDRVWRAARSVLDGSAPPTLDAVRGELVTHGERFLAYGTPAVPVVRDYASRYLLARLGINLLLWHLEEIGCRTEHLTSCEDLAHLLRDVSANREALNAAQIAMTMETLKEEQARTVACKKGIGSNLVEFGRHVLGQRQTANESLRGYDQGYFLRKRAEYASAPWILSLGPVAVLALVHCCLRDSAGPRSVQRLCEHLSLYGLEVDRDDVAKSELGRTLRMLGLVLDSPDAESGMLLVPPFDLGETPYSGTQR